MKYLVVTIVALALSSTSMFGQARPNESRIRVIHASADAPAVDIYANGSLVVEALPFKAASAYLSVPPGSYNIQVRVAGTQTTVLSQPLMLLGGTDYTAFAMGSVSGPRPLFLIALGDNLLPRPAGTISLRVVHAAVSAPTVDVYVGSPWAPVTGATPVLSDVPYGASSLHLDVTNAIYQGRVTVATTKSIAINSPVLRLPGGAVRTLVAVDSKGGGAPFEILEFVDRD